MTALDTSIAGKPSGLISDTAPPLENPARDVAPAEITNLPETPVSQEPVQHLTSLKPHFTAPSPDSPSGPAQAPGR